MKRAVVFSSKLGSVKVIADRIAEATGADKFDLADGAPDVSGYDWIHLGSGIYMGNPPKEVQDFVAANRDKIDRMSLFVACTLCGTRGDGMTRTLAKRFGIADAMYYDKPESQVNVPESKLEEYISGLV
ncbi:MAG: hypothetical protein GX224_06840 [Thermoplasmatales archaeon]|nr:hypothetical protein [Thermoplasmatales archaeon]